MWGLLVWRPCTRAEHARFNGRAVATACVYFRRFSATHDFCQHDPRLTAPACLYLACKAEESQLQAKLLFYAMRKVAGEPSCCWPVRRQSRVTCTCAGSNVSSVICRADKYVGMLVMDAKQLTDMELLVLVRHLLGSLASLYRRKRCVDVSTLDDHGSPSSIRCAGGAQFQACGLPSL